MFYPYGLKHTNYNPDLKKYDKKEDTEEVVLKAIPVTDESKFDYKFNGMEWQDELGLNLYDMEMRDYDPATARWTGMDPVTHHSQSPYNAFDGNPVSIADPSGADGVGGENFTGVWGMSVSNPTNTGMYTGYVDNASFGTVNQGALGHADGEYIFSSLEGISAVMQAYGNPVWNIQTVSNYGSYFAQQQEWLSTNSLNIEYIPQSDGGNDCSFACKQMADKYFNVQGQESINSAWQSEALNSAKGILTEKVRANYINAGYNLNHFGQVAHQEGKRFNISSALRFIIGEISANHIVQFGWRAGGQQGHASLVQWVKYRSDYSDAYFYLQNPSLQQRGQGPGRDFIRGLNNVFDIFSVWK